jgi:hypothetical protein
MTVVSMVTAAEGPGADLVEYEVTGGTYEPVGEVMGLSPDAVSAIWSLKFIRTCILR